MNMNSVWLYMASFLLVVTAGLGASFEAAAFKSQSEPNGEPDMSAQVPTNPPFDPETTVAMDPGGNLLEIDPNGKIRIEGEPIGISVPVKVPEGARVASFLDQTSGISIQDKDVDIPVIDLVTGKPLIVLQGTLRDVLQGTPAGNEASGVFESFHLWTKWMREDMSPHDANVGKLGVSIRVFLERLPQDVRFKMAEIGLLDKGRAEVEVEARKGGNSVADHAGMIAIGMTNLDSKADVSHLEVSMKISARWVDIFGVGNVSIAHVDERGNVEFLPTECAGPDEENNEYTCVGVTRQGFSEFSLLALGKISLEFLVQNLVVAPEAVEPGGTVIIAVDILNTGVEAGSFSAILICS